MAASSTVIGRPAWAGRVAQASRQAQAARCRYQKFHHVSVCCQMKP
jgi:hypothetical protein